MSYSVPMSVIAGYLIEAIKDENTFAEVEAYYSETLRSEAFSLQSVKSLEYLAYIKEELSQGDANIDFPPNTLVCELCNYKGEGEGIALYDDVKHLSIFSWALA